ncbi:MAG: cyclic nucleotide-binding domain-containing protein [bacterium]
MKETNEMQEKIIKLSNIKLFSQIKDDQNALEMVADLFSECKISKGKNVFNEGEFGNELYIIKSGTVEILKSTIHGDSYTLVELSAEQNIFFGEFALLDPDKRSAGVRCITDCEFFVLTRQDFLVLGDSNPKIGLAITRELSRIVCDRIRKSNSDIVTLFGALVNEVAEIDGIEE